jgi:hypothetical protein
MHKESDLKDKNVKKKKKKDQTNKPKRRKNIFFVISF